MHRFGISVLTLFLALCVPASAAAPLLDKVHAATEKLEQAVTKEMKETGVPGVAIVIVYQDQVILAKGYGVREAGQAPLVDADTVFQLASVSKPIGSTVIAALVGAGLVSWDSKISELDPAFALSAPWVTREITLRDVYAHRSGLPAHSGDLLEDIGYSRDEILHRLRFREPDSSFRAGYAYTNFAMTEGAIAAAIAAGGEWETVSEKWLYKPLGMDSTSSRYADFAARENRARGHRQRDGKWVHESQRQPDAQTPAGGVSSSVNDLAKWMRLQLDNGTFEGKPLIAEDAIAEPHHPHMLTGFSPLDGLPGFYGLGWNVRYDDSGRLHLSHSGAFATGAATYVALVPKLGLGIAILTNAAPIGLPEGLANVFLDEVLYDSQRADWIPLFRKVFAQMDEAERAELADYSTRPASPSAASDNAAYLGSYENDYFGEIIVTEHDGDLTLLLGPHKRAFPLTHWNRDIFTYQPPGENAAGTSGVTFLLNPAGTADRVLVENLDVRGNGTFERKHGTP